MAVMLLRFGELEMAMIPFCQNEDLCSFHFMVDQILMRFIALVAQFG